MKQCSTMPRQRALTTKKDKSIQMNIRRVLSILILSFYAIAPSQAQERPIGYWRAHMPYTNAISVATDGVTVFAATDLTFYTYNYVTQELNTYSKVEGMSDVDMKYVAYDVSTGYAVLAYKNGNIDIFKNNTFYNIPDLKIKTVAGDKTINHIYTENGLAYISTTIGIVVVNIEKREIKETYEFTKNNQSIGINGLASLDNYFYAATGKGLFRANKNAPNLQAFSAWTQLDSTHHLNGVAAAGGKLFAVDDSTVLALESDTLRAVYNTPSKKINHIDPVNNELWLSVYRPTAFNGISYKLNASYQLTDSFQVPGEPVQTIGTADNAAWVADAFNGLKRRVSGDALEFNNPKGPSGPLSPDIYAYNNEVYVANGSFSEGLLPTINSSLIGFSQFKNGEWNNFNSYTYTPISNMHNFGVVYKDQATGTAYVGSIIDGVLVINPDGSTQQLKDGSPLEHGLDPNRWQTGGMTTDSKGNLWVTMFGANHELNVKTTDGTWYKYAVPASRPYPNAAGKIVADDNDQLWYVCPLGGGVMVYNYNGTPETGGDDSYRNLGTGVGSGNLPSGSAFCVTKDKSGSIWVGTANGIGIINCPGDVIAGNCEAEQRIVQYDQFAGYLFQGESVKTIAVDGADRKWIGTTNGVWLLSPDASKIIYRFTVDNSPLPSNNIMTIAIDQVTGDVYVGTDKGLVSYRSTATQGGENNDSLLAFPNPVPANYTGTIAVKGIVENADVRITDISGQLIYRTTALGGQAVWNGLDYKGRKPQSGVYLVFITNKDGSQKHVGKIVFLN